MSWTIFFDHSCSFEGDTQRQKQIEDTTFINSLLQCNKPSALVTMDA